MVNPTYQKAILLLEDGKYFEGKACGKIGTTAGEICFNTGMTGYQEIFTDPSYYGQILVATNAHIGNYGTLDDDSESEKVQISGLVCKNFTNDFSRKLADSDLQSYFDKEEVVSISDVDTRAIVRYIRDKGAMNAIISSEILDLDKLKDMMKDVPNMEGLELASLVSTQEPYFKGSPDSEKRIAVLDFGTKQNILECFTSRGCYLKVFNAKSSFAELKKWKPDGYFLSNGPGDPAAMTYAVDTVKQILEENVPVFGICLGHQILALALDIPTYKMHHGHRGINHPVINLKTKKSEITSQNHGFGVSAEKIEARKKDIEITHRNLNDDTIEGLSVIGKNAFSVQYHPEAAPGPHDSRYLFDQFVSLLS